MKILIMASTLESGGTERVINLLSNYFVQNNNVKIIVSRTHHSFYNFDNRVAIDYVQKIDSDNINLVKKIFKIRKIIKEFQPDIVLTFAPHTCFMIRCAIVGLKIPYIISERNNPYVFPSNKLLRFLYFNSFKKSLGVVYQTNDAREYYKKYKIKNEVIIKNPLIKREIKRDKVEKIIVNTGRLTNQKNQKLLIDAFDKFYLTHKDYILKIYGKGELEADLKNYAKSKMSSQNIHFMGTSQQWLEESVNSTMFVLSSDYEGMPNTLIEAMSVGIPSISTDCPIGGSREVINNGENGFLVSVGSVEDLTKRMCELADDIDLQMKFSNESIKINEDLSIDKIANQWLDFINKIITTK